MTRWCCCLAAIAISLPVAAAELRVRVGDDDARAVSDAVVTMVPETGADRRSATSLPEVATIDQKDLAFVPYVQVFRPGGDAVFRNSDRTRHHVYSFSPAKAFEMVLGPGESSDRLSLDKPGVIAIGCNIHDNMIAYLVVSDAPWIARSDADGLVRFRNLPAGAYRVRVWHPRLHTRREDVALPVRLDAATDVRTLTFTLPLLPDSRSPFDREQTRY